MLGQDSREAVILHLSDFHFKSGNLYAFDRDLVLEPLLEKIKDIVKEAAWRPEIVLCTGDVAYSGIPEDYALAEEWFNRLLEIVGLKRERLLVVPGNHDIDISKLSISHQLAITSLTYPNIDELDEKLFSTDPAEFLSISNKLFDSFFANIPVTSKQSNPVWTD